MTLDRSSPTSVTEKVWPTRERRRQRGATRTSGSVPAAMTPVTASMVKSATRLTQDQLGALAHRHVGRRWPRRSRLAASLAAIDLQATRPCSCRPRRPPSRSRSRRSARRWSLLFSVRRVTAGEATERVKLRVRARAMPAGADHARRRSRSRLGRVLDDQRVALHARGEAGARGVDLGGEARGHLGERHRGAHHVTLRAGDQAGAVVEADASPTRLSPADRRAGELHALRVGLHRVRRERASPSG